MLAIESSFDITTTMDFFKIKFVQTAKWHYVLDGKTTFEQMEKLAEALESEWDAVAKDFIMTVKVPFDLWMIALDMEIQKRTALTSSDFPDYDWLGEYEAGISPADSAIEFLFQIENELL